MEIWLNTLPTLSYINSSGWEARCSQRRPSEKRECRSKPTSSPRATTMCGRASEAFTATLNHAHDIREQPTHDAENHGHGWTHCKALRTHASASALETRLHAARSAAQAFVFMRLGQLWPLPNWASSSSNLSQSRLASVTMSTSSSTLYLSRLFCARAHVQTASGLVSLL